MKNPKAKVGDTIRYTDWTGVKIKESRVVEAHYFSGEWQYTMSNDEFLVDSEIEQVIGK